MDKQHIKAATDKAKGAVEAFWVRPVSVTTTRTKSFAVVVDLERRRAAFAGWCSLGPALSTWG